MGELQKRIKNSVIIFLILSVFAHLCTLGIVNLSYDSTKLQSALDRKIEIEIISTPAENKAQQLVEQDEKRVNDEVPEETKYLGRHNQKVIRETRAANTGDFRNSAGGRPGEAPKEAQKENQQAVKAPKVVKKDVADDKGTLPSLSNLNPKFDFSETRRQELAVSNNDNSGLASATNDHLKDTTPSIETLLSSREFVYYTYYQRIRAQIRQHWEPSIREKVRRIFSEGRTIASTRDHITRVIIVLNKNGELVGVQVIGKSGVKDLDDAAVEAFRAAQPFPNPPKGIVESDGTIKINWDFILEA